MTRSFPTPLDFHFLDSLKVQNTLTWETVSKEDYSKKKELESEKEKKEKSKTTNVKKESKMKLINQKKDHLHSKRKL